MATEAIHVYQFGAFRLDAGNRLLYREGDVIALPPKVFDTLLLLVTNSGQVLAKDEMMKRLWPDTFVEEGTLAQYIFLLRKALGNSAAWIENHPRRGYRFTAPVEECDGELVTDQGRIGRFRTIVAALVIAGTVMVAALTWINQKGKAPSPVGSVAVLPFRTVSDSGDDYRADGITDAMITKLANLKGLRVVSYSRVRQFKGASVEAADIGRKLGVFRLKAMLEPHPFLDLPIGNNRVRHPSATGRPGHWTMYSISGDAPSRHSLYRRRPSFQKTSGGQRKRSTTLKPKTKAPPRCAQGERSQA